MSKSTEPSAPTAPRPTSLVPTGIALRFEEVTVQKEPASPVYFEHSFVTWRIPLRGAEASAGTATVRPNAASASTAYRVLNMRTASLVGGDAIDAARLGRHP